MNVLDPTYGLLAEFDDPRDLVEAAKRLRERGYRRMDAYTPYPVEGLSDAIGFGRTRMPLVVLIGGILGACVGYGLQYWVSVIAYPLNIGGRPLHSWPAFIPVTFELSILSAALFAVLGMLALNGLPRPHHPLFDVDAFQRASTDGYFLCVESADPEFDERRLREQLEELKAVSIETVPDWTAW